MMWSSKLRWLLMINFLLSDMALGQTLPPSRSKNSLSVISTDSMSSYQSHHSSINHETIQKEEEKLKDIMKESSSDPAHRLVSALTASLQGHVHLHRNLSCSELAAGPWRGAGFSHELLGLVMVPVLVSAGCVVEGRALVTNLYELLGQDDTQELLEDIVAMIRRDRKPNSHPSNSSSTPPNLRQLQAIMFNIQQLADADDNLAGMFGKDRPGLRKQCQGWLKVQGVHLLGQTADNYRYMHLNEAKQFCQNLGLECAGVNKVGDSIPGLYRVIHRAGSRVVPTTSSGQSETWIQNCGVALARSRRHTARPNDCKNEKEERVYKVVEWIPAVSTLYNLGTAVYYASVKCSDTAKERALFSAVDLGTDALIAVTGGTAGVAGYALGAGLKTGVKAGVKYLLNRMNQGEDLLMNQNIGEEETFIVQ
ncbi:uncharacterized protein apof [Trichomycterus rosablanca]|uniref:uncharacterized protein apof n=1 Tax=Trichomycterus rosablanca TaxID=2290929 RepID=UPI002F35074E